MNINDYKNQNCECGKPRFLTHRVSEAEAGRSVQSLLRNEMQLSGGLAARLKRVENGITLNGEKVFSNVRAAGRGYYSGGDRFLSGAMRKITV